MTSSKQPFIGIVLVNLNSYEDTSRCILSLQAITYKNIKVILVDNGSQDDSPVRLKMEFDSVIHIRLLKNIGSTGGRNAGINHALEIGCEHVLLLDDDTIVTTNFLEPLLERLTSDEAIAAVTGKILKYAPGTNLSIDIIWFAGSERRWHTWFNHRGDGDRDTGQFDAASVTQTMPACLMLMRGSVIREIGAFSDDYFVYWEEADWCARALEAGYSCCYEPKSVIFHDFKSGEPGRESPFYNYLQFRNAFIYNEKHNSFRKQIQFAFALPLMLARRFIVDLLAKNSRGASAVILGVLDYFRGYRGEHGLRERGLLE